MLIEFKVKNYRSFDSEQSFLMIARPDKALEGNSFTLPMLNKGKVLLHSAAVYGANASGKSNLFQAFAFLETFVTNSFNQDVAQIDVSPYRLRAENLKRPSEFTVSFVAEGVRYEYLLDVTPQQVWRERVLAFPQGRTQLWFDREWKPESNRYQWEFGSKLKGEKAQWQTILDSRPNASLLSYGNLIKHPQLQLPYRWFRHNVYYYDEPPVGAITTRFLHESSQIKKFAEIILENADVSVERLEIEESNAPDEIQNKFREFVARLPAIEPEKREAMLQTGLTRLELKAVRKSAEGHDVTFDWKTEISRGTQQLYGWFQPIFSALKQGSLLIIDELDSGLHTDLVQAIVALFHHPKINTKHAQLIFTTHDTNLMRGELFQREQLWFVEKKRAGNSELYSLADFSPRKEEKFEQAYLGGRYGAVPYLEAFATAWLQQKKLSEKSEDEQERETSTTQ